MKKIAVLLLMIVLFLSSCSVDIPDGESSNVNESSSNEVSDTSVDVSGETSEVEERKVINYDNVKAIWVSQFDMADVYRLNGNDYVKAVEVIVKNIKNLGLNTVYYQIRPYGDSFYKSEFFPNSRFTSAVSYDAVGIFVEACKKNGLSVHAWINPYRLETEKNMGDGSQIPVNSPLFDMYKSGELCVWQERYYLNPANPKSIDLVCNGAKEALCKYEFDGLHMDDYFYPTQDAAFDKEFFENSGESNLREFREQSVNKLVKKLYETVKSVDSRLLYGISPAGNLSNVKQVYFADVYEWCKTEGYIDYIAPQVYFGFLHGVCPFSKTVDDWADIIKLPSVKLVVGMTLGKACSGEPDTYAKTEEGKFEWINHKDVIKRSVEYVNNSSYCSGYSLFCYQYLYNPIMGTVNPAILAEMENFSPTLQK